MRLLLLPLLLLPSALPFQLSSPPHVTCRIHSSESDTNTPINPPTGASTGASTSELYNPPTTTAITLSLPPDNPWPRSLTLFNKIYLGKALSQDIKRRAPHYVSDYTTALTPRNIPKTIPAILFLFFACLSPAVSFGAIARTTTNGAIGVVEFLLSCSLSGIFYAIFSGQPMAFLAPTGLTLAFITALHRYCIAFELPFLPIYAYVGLWTALFQVITSVTGASR